MMQIRILLISALSLCLAISCGQNGGRRNHKQNLADRAAGNMQDYIKEPVNAIEQARPTIMIIPGDHVLQTFGCLKNENINGVSTPIRDYQKYLLTDKRAKSLYAVIASKFVEENYPLTDLEQNLKSLANKNTADLADGISKDSKTLLLQTAHPDMILEFEYNSSEDARPGLTSHNYTVNSNAVGFSLSALDAYTNKVISSVSESNLSGKTTLDAIRPYLRKSMPNLMNDIVNYFCDILTRGREVTVTINVDANCNIALSDESIEGDTYADWIIDFIKTHSVKGAYEMDVNTSKELSFSNVRIPLIQDDGTQYGVYDWTRDLQKNLRENLGVRSINRSQGLGNIVLTLKKL